VVTGEVGKAASGFMAVMQGQPLALALVVMNFALIGFTYYQSSIFNTQRQDNVKLFIDVQKEVQKLLSQCIVPPPVDSRRGDLSLPFEPASLAPAKVTP
jgi:hypothetical protein